MSNYQWLPSVVGKYAAEYKRGFVSCLCSLSRKGIDLSAEQIARATLAIREQTKDGIEALLAQEFDICQTLSADAPKHEKINARRIENTVCTYVYCGDTPYSGSIPFPLTNEDALIVYFLYGKIKGIPQYKRPSRIGKTLLKTLQQYLQQQGILKNR